MSKSRLNLMCVVMASIVISWSLAAPQKALGIPAFARQYNTSCTTCHTNFPKLNDFGRAFKDAGFKFPKDDEGFLKVPNIMLGAPAQKELWPKSVWPGTIPGLPPIGFRMNNFFQVVGRNRNQIANALTPTGSVPPFIPRTDFQTGFFSIFAAGNFGSDIAFWVDDDISIGGANSNGGLGDGYLKFVNLGRLAKLPTDSFSLRLGQFELDLPFTQARSYNLSPYDIYSQANIGAMNSLFPSQQNVNNTFAFSNVAQGVEISGGHSYGGYHYSLALVNQNTGGSIASSDFVPSATGGASGGGVGFFSDSNFKDLYGRMSYRFNLERDATSRKDVQAAGSMGPHDHTSLNIGTFYLYGRSVQRFAGETSGGAPAVLTAREPFYRTGGDFNFNYRLVNIYGLFMYGHDHNLLPVDSTGTIIPLPLSAPVATGFTRSIPAKFSGGFVQADLQFYPWLMGIMRWDSVNSSADRLNGLAQTTGTSFFAPYKSTRNRITPGIQFLIHANIKMSAEYQFRPQQSVTSLINPLTGQPMPTNPFRTNTVTFGTEFVF